MVEGKSCERNTFDCPIFSLLANVKNLGWFKAYLHLEASKNQSEKKGGGGADEKEENYNKKEEEI